MKRQRRAAAAAVLIAAATMLSATACERDDNTPRLRVEVVATRPHDRTAFTEGLEVDGPVLYESTGMEGDSGVRATDLATGAPIAAAKLSDAYFGEGITRAGDTVWQLTWKNETALARDPRTLTERRRVRYDGEGWGLCTRGDRLVMSDGSDTLTFRDPNTFATTGTIRLTSHHDARLNELDCAADGSIYANVWPTDQILHIDPVGGAVLAEIEAGGLLRPTERTGADVLNGIAQLPGTDHFLITGKYWPTMFEVRFVPM
ncbi:glutaminyl-peptide cyclotransferase [Nocardia nova]|uniref:Glutaminyl-peptide cyclotransferase n=1 Tax=Nocardia nova TaxID=37330 RepID=A0A2S6AXP4_9NOCA|nr:glutaminyl-peptide cyclotransferase [Nocardia nova]PPJ34194.1 glutaminyl-peptide cyclotransferase [Nocardia nova]PPJ39999.1 glutaminyl-peptide cyclotransferase [Nocardia nova]